MYVAQHLRFHLYSENIQPIAQEKDGEGCEILCTTFYLLCHVFQ